MNNIRFAEAKERRRSQRELEANGFVRDAEEKWTIIQPDTFRRAVTEEYYLPLIDHVLGADDDSARAKSAEPDLRVEKTSPDPPAPSQPARRRIEIQKPTANSQVRPSLDLTVHLGVTSQNDDYYWNPLEEPNPHLLIVGSPGMGKSQTAKSVILQFRRQKVPAFIIDFENEYGDQQLTSLVLKPGEDVTVNPLDLLEGDPRVVKFRLAGILKKIYNLGDQQEALVRRAITAAYESSGIYENDHQSWLRAVPAFDMVKDTLEFLGQGKGPDVNRARATLNRLEPLFDLKVFSGQTQIAFETILKDGAVVFLKDLPTEETKLAAAEFFLRWLWQRISQEGEIQGQIRMLVVLDEAHKLAYDNSPVASFLRQGRKYGLSCLMATQQPDDFESEELAFQNTSVHLTFGCNSDKHARKMAKEMFGGENIYQRIRLLKRFEVLIFSHGSGATESVTVKPYFELIQE